MGIEILAVKNKMIELWGITNTDFMGYKLCDDEVFSYHHLRIPKKDNGHVSIKNGAILTGKTAHPYLHTIEVYDRDRFLYLTKILIDVNDQGYLPDENQLHKIDTCLSFFEKEYSGKYSSGGNLIIKDRYTRRLIR